MNSKQNIATINSLYSEIRELQRSNEIELARAIHYRAEWQDSQARIRELEKKLADIAAIIKG